MSTGSPDPAKVETPITVGMRVFVETDGTTGTVEQVAQGGQALVRVLFDDGNPSPLTAWHPVWVLTPQE